MELGTKVTALEEEIAVLKGEIKTILQEVRTAVLARENPFATDQHVNLQISQLPAEPTVAEAPSGPETPPQVIKLPQPAAEPDLEPQVVTQTAFSGRHETDVARPTFAATPSRPRWSVGSLATLIAWTQETATRMDAGGLDILLSLARYGGLIDEELEATLTKLAAPLVENNAQSQPKGVTDYLLALRELSALIEEAEESNRGPGPMRRAS